MQQSEKPAAKPLTVLVVEDEPLVRELVVDMLEPDGHRVLTAEDGLKALAIVEEEDGQIDLLITDVMMPIMSGVDLARRVRLRSKGLRVLFMSGYDHEALTNQGMADEHAHVLQKPFGPDALARMVRVALGPRA